MPANSSLLQIKYIVCGGVFFFWYGLKKKCPPLTNPVFLKFFSSFLASSFAMFFFFFFHLRNGFFDNFFDWLKKGTILFHRNVGGKKTCKFCFQNFDAYLSNLSFTCAVKSRTCWNKPLMLMITRGFILVKINVVFLLVHLLNQDSTICLGIHIDFVKYPHDPPCPHNCQRCNFFELLLVLTCIILRITGWMNGKKFSRSWIHPPFPRDLFVLRFAIG